MKTQFKNPIKNFATIFLMLVTMFLMGFGCNTSKTAPTTTDPLIGFRIYVNHDPDQNITKDYQDYIQKLSPEERKYAGPINFYEDGTGQHAVQIRIGINGTDWWHVLIYDKDDKRIKTIKYAAGDYHS